jgi:hypothetical protein
MVKYVRIIKKAASFFNEALLADVYKLSVPFFLVGVGGISD